MKPRVLVPGLRLGTQCWSGSRLLRLSSCPRETQWLGTTVGLLIRWSGGAGVGWVTSFARPGETMLRRMLRRGGGGHAATLSQDSRMPRLSNAFIRSEADSNKMASIPAAIAAATFSGLSSVKKISSARTPVAAIAS